MEIKLKAKVDEKILDLLSTVFKEYDKENRTKYEQLHSEDCEESVILPTVAYRCNDEFEFVYRTVSEKGNWHIYSDKDELIIDFEGYRSSFLGGMDIVEFAQPRPHGFKLSEYDDKFNSIIICFNLDPLFASSAYTTVTILFTITNIETSRPDLPLGVHGHEGRVQIINACGDIVDEYYEKEE